MKKIILASNNNHKVEEIKNILKDINIDVKSLKEENIDIDIIEDGSTFEENAMKKAKGIADYLKLKGEEDFIVMADDSGIEVDYLNGAPGIYSARYAGKHGNDDMNNEKLLKELIGVPEDKRTARFVCQIVLVDSNNKELSIRGEVEGKILKKINGNGGFGYDPLFYYEPLKKSFGELSSEEKNKISHRAKALIELKQRICEIL